MANGSVIALDISGLPGLSGLDMADADLALFSPPQEWRQTGFHRPGGHGSVQTILKLEGNPYAITGLIEGQHLTDMQKPWRRLRHRTGLDGVRIHDLRHSFASDALQLGEDLTMIGKLLGHTQVQTTASYAHLKTVPIRAAADKVSAAIATALQKPEQAA